MIPRLRRCSGFNVIFVLPLVERRRLDPNESQPLPYKDGQPHFIMTTLKIICAPSTQLNGHNMRPLNPTMSTINYFVDIPVAFKNSIKAYYSSSSLGTECQIVFDINRNIVDTIISNMLFDLANDSNNDEDFDVEDLVFGNEVELNVVMCDALPSHGVKPI